MNMGWDNPGMAKLLGNPSILGQGGHMTVHPGIIQGWPSYLGIPRYLDTGGHMAIHPGIIPGYVDKAGKGQWRI